MCYRNEEFKIGIRESMAHNGTLMSNINLDHSTQVSGLGQSDAAVGSTKYSRSSWEKEVPIKGFHIRVIEKKIDLQKYY